MTTSDHYKQYNLLCQHVSYYLNMSLSFSESRVLMFIINRTIRFNKTTEKIPSRHFMEGIVSSKGDAIIGPAGVSRRSLTEAIKSLQKKRLIEVAEVGTLGTNFFKVLVDNIWRLINMAVSKLKLSKKAMNSTMAKTARGYSKNCATYKGKEKKVGERTKNTPKTGFRDEEPVLEQTLDEFIDETIEAYDKKLAALVDKVETATADNVRTVWKKSIRDYRLDNPDVEVIPPTSKVVGRLSSNLKFRYGKNEAWKKIIYQAVTEWDELIDYFKWMGNIPSTPSLDFIQKHFKRIVEFTQRSRGKNIVDAKRKEEHDAVMQAAQAKIELQQVLKARDQAIADIDYARQLLDEEKNTDVAKDMSLGMEALEKIIESQNDEIDRLRKMIPFDLAEGHDLPEWNDRDN